MFKRFKRDERVLELEVTNLRLKARLEKAEKGWLDAEVEAMVLRHLLEKERGGRPFLEELAAGTEFTPERVKYLLGRIDDEDETYRAVLKVIQRQSELELSVALRPEVGNEDRQYGAGRAAAVADVLFMLESTRAEGRRLAEGGAGEERRGGEQG